MLLDLLAVVVGQLVDVIDEEALQALDELGPIVGRAHRVDHQVDLAQADPGVEVPQQRDDLEIEVGVGRSDGLGAELVMLAVPRRLRGLVAKARGGVPDLPRRRRPVLDVRPHDGCGALGAQRQVAIALVEEVVHLLADDVRAFAHPAEDTDLLEHRALQQPVARPARRWSRSVRSRPPSVRTPAAARHGCPSGRGTRSHVARQQRRRGDRPRSEVSYAIDYERKWFRRSCDAVGRSRRRCTTRCR